MKQHQNEFEVKVMCEVFKVSRSGYYDYLKAVPKPRMIANQCLDEKIHTIYHQHQGRYGAVRVHRELGDQNEPCSLNRVARRMSALGLKGKARKKFKVTTDSKHNLPVAENLLARDFSATAPNQKWVGDITYIATQEGWLYLAVIIDLYSRAVIGWSMGHRIDKALVCNALLMALWRRKFPQGVMVHSDRDSQYCSEAYQTLLNQHQLLCSMSRKGNCWDNAVAESFFHTLKVEGIDPICFATREEARQCIFQYIEGYYNQYRKHSAIDYQAPFKFECAQLAS